MTVRGELVTNHSPRPAMRKLVALVAAITIILPSIAMAQVTSRDVGLTDTARTAGFDTSEDVVIGTYIGERIIDPLFSLMGIIFLILIIYGGILWMTGGGNPETIKKAKSILVNSLIGLLIILLSYGFTIFVFQQLTGG